MPPIIVVFVFASLMVRSLQENGDNNRLKRSIQTAGFGCEILKSNLLREPIPGTHLNTGTFYILRELSGSENVRSALASGYITWSGSRHPNNVDCRYVFSDKHHNMELYTEGAAWYKDSQWAFLRSKQKGWYHLVNCGHPNLYATWSNWEEEDDNSGAFPMILDANYPGNHTKIDFLFKPVHLKSVGINVFQVMSKSFEGGIVSVSSTIYKGQSNYLQVESHSIWKEGVKIKGREEKRAMFIFENAKDSYDSSYSDKYSDGNASNVECAHRQSTIFVWMLFILAWLTVILFWSKKSVVTQYFIENKT